MADSARDRRGPRPMRRRGGETNRLDHMQRLTLVLLVLAVLAPADASPGTEPATLEACAAAIDQAATQPDGERVVVGHISRKLAVPVDTLRAQRLQNEIAWGSLLIANHLAALTGLTVEEIATEYRARQSWSEVAEGHAVATSSLLLYLQQSLETIEQRSEDKNPRGDSGQTPGRSGHSAGGGHRRQ